MPYPDMTKDITKDIRKEKMARNVSPYPLCELSVFDCPM